MLRVFVTGRATDLGRAVITDLLAQGHCVTVFGTGHERDLKGVVTLVSSLAEPAVMRIIAERTDAIIHCEGPAPGTARSVAGALCGMLSALPPHGRLISAMGAIWPECPDAAAIDRAILAASGGGPQSVYVLAPVAAGSVQGRNRQHPKMSRAAPPPQSETMSVAACAGLLACLADNGAFGGGVVGCAPLETSQPIRPVHPARRRLGLPQAPETFGHVASSHLQMTVSNRPRLHGAGVSKIGTIPAVAAPQGAPVRAKVHAP